MIHLINLTAHEQTRCLDCPSCGDDHVSIVSVKSAIGGTICHARRAGLSTSTHPFRGRAVKIRLACEGCGMHFDFSLRTRCGRTEVVRG